MRQGKIGKVVTLESGEVVKGAKRNHPNYIIIKRSMKDQNLSLFRSFHVGIQIRGRGV